ncbi:hypothetical protein QBC47DRAFT_392241 [Echria macrotheca]|uniref:Uncharacterized protein n=1 Tax=Echria macrotheca TaxID=438768 RepID=A0AAJ0F7F8_9PEZI|nr:hypothetical protein QBC47DRAFT_392241 [Echria macrotheca]
MVVHGRLGLLVSLACGAALATPFAQQQYLIGDTYPYGYSPDDFRKATSKTNAVQSVAVPGFDITAAPGNNGTAATQDFSLDGWRLVVGVTGDVAIPSNSPDSQGGSKVFDTAVLSLTPPAKIANNLGSNPNTDSWSVCSAIWAMGLSSAALSGAAATSDASGSCSGLLSPDCIAEMEAGFNSAGFCQNQTMPLSCATLLANGTDGVTSASNLPQTIGGLIADGPFFAAATLPLDKGNSTALNEVSTWVFPVVLSWRYSGSSVSALGGPGGDTVSHLACVRAAAGNGKTNVGGVGLGSGSWRPTPAWLSLSLVVSWAMTL